MIGLDTVLDFIENLCRLVLFITGTLLVILTIAAILAAPLYLTLYYLVINVK